MRGECDHSAAFQVQRIRINNTMPRPTGKRNVGRAGQKRVGTDEKPSKSADVKRDIVKYSASLAQALPIAMYRRNEARGLQSLQRIRFIVQAGYTQGTHT